MDLAHHGPLHISQIRKAFLAKFQIESPLESQKPEKKGSPPQSKKQKESLSPDEILIQLRKEWPKLSAALHKYSYPAAIKGDTLIVYLSHSVYLTEFQFQKQAIAKKILALSNGRIRALSLKYNNEHNFSG